MIDEASRSFMLELRYPAPTWERAERARRALQLAKLALLAADGIAVLYDVVRLTQLFR